MARLSPTEKYPAGITMRKTQNSGKSDVVQVVGTSSTNLLVARIRTSKTK
jgi:hypothetical protein